MCPTAVEVIDDLEQAAFYEAAFSGSPESPYWFRRQKDYLVRNRICISSSLMRADLLNQVPFSLSYRATQPVSRSWRFHHRPPCVSRLKIDIF